jgi:predicted TPR repeat methyltransferase
VAPYKFSDEISQTLHHERRVEASSADLIIAADVLLYFRDLSET